MSYYDPLETRDPGEREDDLMDKLARQVAHAKEKTSYYFSTLAGINPFECTSRAALARLPLTSKAPPPATWQSPLLVIAPSTRKVPPLATL